MKRNSPCNTRLRFTIPFTPEQESGFRQKEAAAIIKIGRIMLPLIFLVELFNLLYAFVRWHPGAKSLKIYGTLYAILLAGTIAVVVAAFIICRYRPTRLEQLLNLQFFYSIFICLWCTAVNLYDLRVTENVSVYITCAVSAAVLVRLRPWQTLTLFVGNHILFLSLFTTFQPGPTNNWGNYTNTTVLVAISIIISLSQYRNRREIYLTQDTLLQRNKEIERMNQELWSVASTDALTCLNNRRFWDETIPSVWADGVKKALPVSLIMLDIDDFKKYNDRYGHQAGDRCLKSIARVLTGFSEQEDLWLIRYGGEEFLALLIGADASRADALAEKIRQGVQDLRLPHDDSTSGVVTISGGVYTSVPAESVKPEDFLRKADLALYRAKTGGKNRIVHYASGASPAP